jgi:hypothetical protein
MTLLVRVVALAAAVLLAGCYPTSVHPIGSTAPSSIDARLVGGWKALPKDKKSNPTYLFFLQRKEGMEAVMVGAPDAGDDGGWMTFGVTTAKLGANTFMSGRTLLDDGKVSKDPDYTPVFYRIDGQMLRLYVLDTDAIEAAINKGEIKGDIKKNSYGDDVRITADAKAVDAFFASHDPKKLFTEELGTYRRLR